MAASLFIACLCVFQPLRAEFYLGANIINQSGGAAGVDFDGDAANPTAGTPDLVLTPSLRLGLLTVAPGANLHVAGNVFVRDHLIITQTSSAPAIASGNTALYVNNGDLYFLDATGASVAITTVTLGSAWITSSSNAYIGAGNLVGIGTVTPSANLDVAGSVKVSGQVLLPDGTAAAPALAFTGDTGTGLFLSGTGNIGVSASGTQRLAIDGTCLKLLNGTALKTDRRLGTDLNTFLGVGAGGPGTLVHATNDEGWYNTAVGWQAMGNVTTGSYNTAVGARALASLTTGQADTAVGFQALLSCTSGSNNTAVGANCMSSLTTGSFNTAMGDSAMYAMTTGSNNTAVGAASMANVIGGSRNTAFGWQALCGGSGASCDDNTALGAQALYSVTSGSNNTAAGVQALYFCTTGMDNAALGHQAGYNLTIGSNNVLLGFKAGYNLAGGGNNVLIGFQAGQNLTSGCNNIVIGNYLNASSATASHELQIGGLISGNLLSGMIGIGTSAPSGNLQVNGNIYCGNMLPSANMQYDLGSASLAWSALYTRDEIQTSDRRLKTDIRPLAYGLEQVRLLRPVRFRWADGGGERLGFIAQEVREVIPEAVAGSEAAGDLLGLRGGALLPVLAGAARESASRHEADVAGCRERLERLAATDREIEAALRDLRDGRRSGP